MPPWMAMADDENNGSSRGGGRGRRRIDYEEHRHRPSTNGHDPKSYYGGAVEWGRRSPTPFLSNVGNALKSAFESLRADIIQTAVDDPILRFPLHDQHSQGTDIRVRRNNRSRRKRRVLAAISLSQTGGNDSTVARDVNDVLRSPGSGDAPISTESSPRRSAPNPKRGWFSEVGQARAFYKQISLVDRTRIGAMAGGLAGGFTYCCLHPIDTVRTRLQTRGAAHMYSNGFEVVISILKTKGVLGFYSGISAVLVGSMLSSAVYFGCIELGRSALVKYTSFSPLLIPPLSGAFGNIISSTILVPKEVITHRMQAGASGRSWDLALRTVRNEGVRGLYAGYFAALLRNLPSSVLSFTTFEYVKAVWLRNTGKKSLEPWQSVFSGAMAGAISGALTTPLDVVKTRLMTQAKKEVMGAMAGEAAAAELRAKIAASSYKGISSTLKQIWVEEGWIGLTKGMGPRLLHSAMFSALGYFAFETVRVELVKRHMAKLKSPEATTIIL